MTIEDFVLQFEGLDPAKVKQILHDVSHLMDVVKIELPRLQRLIVNMQSQIAAYEANQRRFGG